MTPSIKGTLAAGLAAATILSGLSFGPAAASATPATSTNAMSTPFQLIWSTNGKFYTFSGLRESNYLKEFATQSAAAAEGRFVRYDPAVRRVTLADSPNYCLSKSRNNTTYTAAFSSNCNSTQDLISDVKFTDGRLTFTTFNTPQYVSSIVHNSVGYIGTFGTSYLPIVSDVPNDTVAVGADVVAPATSPGFTSGKGTIRFRSTDISGNAVVKAPAGTTFGEVRALNSSGGAQGNYTITYNAARTEATITGPASAGSEARWGSSHQSIDFTLAVGASATPGATLSGGRVTVTRTAANGGAKTAEQAFTMVVAPVNGGVDPSTFSTVTLARGADTNVQYGIKTKADGFNKLQGSVVLTAPTGTAFKTGQTTLQGQYRHAGQTNWSNTTSLNLTGGTLSNSNRTLTFQIDTPTMSLSNNSEVRWGTVVTTPSAAAAGTGALGFTVAGTSNKGTFRAQGSTPTVLNAALVASVTSVDNVAKTAVIGGTATKGAKVKVGTREVTANATTGAWTMTLTGLATGANSRTVEQFVGTTKVDQVNLSIQVPVVNDGITAEVAKVNNIAGTAVITGTATKRATVKLGTQEVTADATTGNWTMTIGDLGAPGTKTRVFEQFIGGTKDGQAEVQFVVGADGKLVGAAAPDVTLNRGGDTWMFTHLKTAEEIASATGTATFTAPAGTTFKADQDTILGNRKTGDNWGGGTAYAALTDGVRSADGKTYTYQVALASDSGTKWDAGQEVRFPIAVSTPQNAAAGESTMTAVFAGDTNKGDYRVQGSTKTTLNAALVASVTSVDNVAKTAVIGGTATPGAKVKVGTQEVTANATTGAWTMTLTGLDNGDNSRTVEQFVGTTKVDQVNLSIQVLANGGVDPSTFSAITLGRGGDTRVQYGIKTKADGFNSLNGTVVLNAPAGTTFKSGEPTLQGQYRHAGQTSWSNTARLNLTGGTLSNSDSTITYQLNATGISLSNDSEVRWGTVVTTPSGATAGNGTLGFTIDGTSNKGTYRALGSTPTVINAALTAEVRKVNNIAKSAVIGGVAAPGATVKVGTQEVTAHATTGAWTMTVTGLNVGAQNRTVEQFIGSQKIDQTTVAITIGENGTIVPGTSPATEIAAGETKSVQVLATANGKVELPEGTMTFTAPEGTTFPAGQNTINGQFQQGGSGSWSGTGMQLTGGVRSADGKTYTYEWKTSTGSPTWAVNDNSNVRWSINVAAAADATATPTSLGFVLAGDAKQGDFRAQGSTAVTIESAAVAAPLEVTAPVNGSTVTSARPTFAGTGDAGATIEVRGSTRVVATTVVDERGNWSVPADMDLRDGGYSLTVKQTPLRGETTSKTVAFTVRAVEVIAPVTVTSPAAGTVVETRMPKFTGTGHEGATVVVRGSTNRLGTATVVDGKWELTSSISLANNDYNLYVDQTVNGKTTTIRHAFTVNNPITAPITVTTPVQGSELTEVDTLRPTFTGTATPDAEISIGSARTTVATAKADSRGNWTAPTTIDLMAGGTYTLTATQTKGGKTSATPAAFKVSRTASALRPLVLSAPAQNSTVNTVRPTFTGTATPNAKITVGSSRVTIAEGTANAAGQFSFVANRDLERGGTYQGLTVRQTTTDDRTSTTTSSFVVAKDADSDKLDPITVSSPAAGEVVTTVRPTFVGKATPNATITIGSSKTTVATGKANAQGDFSLVSMIDLAKGGTYTGLTVKQEKDGLTSSTKITFSVARDAS